jgi:isoleucyl-tRNA synthetase
MDWPHSYYTHTDNNIEHIWYFLKRCYEKGWLYKGHRSMPWCTRCGTSLSQHELIDAYREVTHTSVYLNLPIRERPGEYMLVWTTTPWTLTANVALAVHPDLYYTKIRQNGMIAHLSHGTVSRLTGEYEVLGAIKGEDLVGLTYNGPFDDLPAQGGITHRIIPWEDVGEAEGTGVVHIAPGCGAEDYELSTVHDLPVIIPVDENGDYVDGFGFLSGQNVAGVTGPIFEDLRRKGYLYRLEDYTHRYPECWRCHEELVFRVVDEWFILCEEIRPLMIDAARTVTWRPDYAGKRMEDWLKNMGDWCISRKRYWGLPLPFYPCSCGELTVVGSKAQLECLAVSGLDTLSELHRPWIDEVIIRCPTCGGEVRRIPEVGDCWLDAGIVPFSTLGYIHEEKTRWEAWYPADFITEMREQIRLWFYSMLFMSVTLEGKAPYRNVLTHERVHDEHGQPMHKSAGNAIWFDEAVERMGADVMRWIYARQNPSLDLRFGYGPAEDVKRTFLTFWNTYNFFVTYANLDHFDPRETTTTDEDLTLLDRWILAKLHLLITTARSELDDYSVVPVVRMTEEFFDDLSNWYVRRSRRRFWKSENDRDKAAAYTTLYAVLVTTVKLLAPIVPFLSEEVYQNLVRSVDADALLSVHLTGYPDADERLIDRELIDQMSTVMRIVSLGRSARNTAQIKVRQPLSTLFISPDRTVDGVDLRRFDDLIKDELNVKTIEVVDDVSRLVHHTIKPNYALLGPKLGALMPHVRAALGAIDPVATADRVSRGLPLQLIVDSRTVEILPEEVTVEVEPQEGLIATTEGGWVVAMDATLTEDLQDEGFAREFVHRIQNMRKEAGFSVPDRIEIAYRVSKRLRRALVHFEDYIKTETLCRILREGDDSGEIADSCKINGEEAWIAVKRVDR